jgi:hypothetical protein
MIDPISVHHRPPSSTMKNHRSVNNWPHSPAHHAANDDIVTGSPRACPELQLQDEWPNQRTQQTVNLAADLPAFGIIVVVAEHPAEYTCIQRRRISHGRGTFTRMV